MSACDGEADSWMPDMKSAEELPFVSRYLASRNHAVTLALARASGKPLCSVPARGKVAGEVSTRQGTHHRHAEYEEGDPKKRGEQNAEHDASFSAL